MLASERAIGLDGFTAANDHELSNGRSKVTTEAHFQQDGYSARWYAEVRLLSLAFQPQTHMNGTTTAAMFQFMEPYISDGQSWLMLTDAVNVINVDADTRRLARDFFSLHRTQLRFGAYGANILVRTMFSFFVNTAGIMGRMFATREQALNWLGIPADHPVS